KQLLEGLSLRELKSLTAANMTAKFSKAIVERLFNESMRRLDSQPTQALQ
ncbi:hypothetical protein AAVH_37280, partial [Aphelenchoides avenae]